MQMNNGSNAYQLETIIERADSAKKRNSRYSVRNPKRLWQVLLIIIVFGVAFFICTRYVEIYGQNEEIQRRVKEIEQIQALNTQIYVNIEKEIDLNSIENYARTYLGMSPPDRSQIVYITATGADVMEKTVKGKNTGVNKENYGVVPEK